MLSTVYHSWEAIPLGIKRQLYGMGSNTTFDSLRRIAMGKQVDDGMVTDKIAIVFDKNARVLSWGILYWDDYGLYDTKGIQLYTRVQARGKGYAKQVYTMLRALCDKQPIVSVFKDNITFWKKVGAVNKYINISLQRTRPTEHRN